MNLNSKCIYGMQFFQKHYKFSLIMVFFRSATDLHTRIKNNNSLPIEIRILKITQKNNWPLLNEKYLIFNRNRLENQNCAILSPGQYYTTQMTFVSLNRSFQNQKHPHRAKNQWKWPWKYLAASYRKFGGCKFGPM